MLHADQDAAEPLSHAMREKACHQDNKHDGDCSHERHDRLFASRCCVMHHEELRTNALKAKRGRLRMVIVDYKSGFILKRKDQQI